MTIWSAARAESTILRPSRWQKPTHQRIKNRRHPNLMKTSNLKNQNLTKAENSLRPFHLAFPVDDLPAARKFYTEVLGCTTGREKEESCVFNFYGHQIVAHRVPKMPELSTSPVDGKKVPAMHFGLVLEWGDWQELRDQVRNRRHRFCNRPIHTVRGPTWLTSDHVHQRPMWQPSRIQVLQRR